MFPTLRAALRGEYWRGAQCRDGLLGAHRKPQVCCSERVGSVLPVPSGVGVRGLSRRSAPAGGGGAGQRTQCSTLCQHVALLRTWGAAAWGMPTRNNTGPAAVVGMGLRRCPQDCEAAARRRLVQPARVIVLLHILPACGPSRTARDRRRGWPDPASTLPRASPSHFPPPPPPRRCHFAILQAAAQRPRAPRQCSAWRMWRPRLARPCACPLVRDESTGWFVDAVPRCPHPRFFFFSVSRVRGSHHGQR